MNKDERHSSEIVWVEAFEEWLEGRASENTRKAYSSAWRRLIEHTQKLPWEINRQDISGWVEEMAGRGLSRKTIQLRLGAISSFYTHGSGRGQIAAANPARGIPITVPRSPRRLTAEMLEAFLRAIPAHSLAGKRDYALFLCCITTRRRNGEVRRMKRRQFLTGSENQAYTGTPRLEWGSGKKRSRVSCPPRLWEAFQQYFDACPSEHEPDDYVFTAWKGGRSSGKPLTSDTVCKLVKKYARLAGLESWITVESLRRSNEPHP